MEEKDMSEELNPHLKGYKKCCYCGKYYDMSVAHPCYVYHNKIYTEHGKRRYIRPKTSDKECYVNKESNAKF